MRLLTNIFHEFVIYRKILKPEFIKKNDELFAIITYKNLDPRDFTELNRKEGKLYKLINSKRNYIEKYLSKINEEIMLKNSKIDDFEKHMIEDTNELRAIYINRVQGELQKTENTGSINIAKLIEDEGFRSVLKGKVSFEKFATDHSYYQKYTKVASDFSFDFKELQNAVNSDFSYEQRLEMIKAKGSGKIEMLKKEIEKLKSTRSDIENWDLTQIFEQVNISEYLKEFNNNGLVRNFILNGHINENYNDYISLFHGVTITKEDLAFERNVKGGYYTSFNYQLSDKIESLIARLDGKYFRRDLVLNFDLVDFLGKNYSEYSDKYDSIISLLSNEKEKSIQFIDEYIEDDKRQLNVFIEKLVEIWTGFWDYIYSKYSEDRKTKYLELIIQFAKIETILKGQNNNGSLKLAIEERKDFLLLVKNTEKRDLFDKTLRILKELDIKFEKLDYPNEETRRLFDTVYRNNHYLLNEHNILQMLTIYAKEHQVEKFYSSNYSAILGSECKPLIDYINSSKMHYVEEVYLALENNNYEDESNLILLLNDEDITIQSKASIIKKVETRVVDLSSIIQFDVKTELLECKKLIPNWRNVINYYSMSENTINENLINYLNDEATFTELSKFKLNEKNEDFEGILIKCKELLDVAYSALLNSVHYNWKSIDFENLNIEKVLNLLDNKLITTKSNYDRLREYFPKNHIALIEKNFAAFLDKQDDFVTDENDVLLILMSDKISIKDKFTYASTLEENLILGSLKISQAIGFVIIQNSIAIKFVYSTIEAMVKASELRENKVRLINLYSDSLNNSELIGITSLVGWNYKELFKKQHKPIFNDTLYNQELFKILTVKGLIKRYGVDKKDNSKIRVIANY